MKQLVIVGLLLASAACRPDGEPASDRRPSDRRRAPEAASPAGGSDTEPGRPDPARPGGNDGPALATGQRLYVPVYSHVYWGPKAKQFNLACALSIRNIDTEQQIVLAVVDYYDTEGALVGHYIDQEITLGPLETTEFYVEERDATGGSGANFLVDWRSQTPVNPPVVEAVMIGIDSAQGISFVSPAREILDSTTDP